MTEQRNEKTALSRRSVLGVAAALGAGGALTAALPAGAAEPPAPGGPPAGGTGRAGRDGPAGGAGRAGRDGPARGAGPAGRAGSGGSGGVGALEGAIDTAARRLDADLIALRRDIHAHPELAGGESRTSALVAARLRAAGLAVTTGVGGHGVVAVLQGTASPGEDGPRRGAGAGAGRGDGGAGRGTGAHASGGDGARRGAGGGAGRTVAYRADMDAVPPDSQIHGGPAPAHLCGHDLHTTIGVGVAEVLARLRHRVRGRFVFLFQPGEEALTGARAMIDAGVLERTRPDEIHALHCGPFPVGGFAVTPGAGLPGLDHCVTTLTGPDAADQAGRLVADVARLGTVTFPEAPAELERIVRELQMPHGPLSRFVFVRAGTRPVFGGVEVRTAYRCWPQERVPEIRAELRRLAGRYAGSQTTFPPDDPFPAMVCPPRPGRELGRHLSRMLGADRVTTLHAALPFSGEDFALFLNRVPGTFTFLGVRRPGAELSTAYPHFGAFDPDERAIGAGVRAMAGWLAHRATAAQ
ncbi:M20/M25/M40 family metallo-hydrolase [Actinomadura gamaensis]|uniref:M20/M25/M40 family metallo-hydrolase n=1 Tax=Actinomadura gamaensis TaxID=1763541 RepID=A0ABV9TWM2_9ACTN